MSNPFEVPLGTMMSSSSPYHKDQHRLSSSNVIITKEIAPKATSGFRSLLEKAMTVPHQQQASSSYLPPPSSRTQVVVIPTIVNHKNDDDPNINPLLPPQEEEEESHHPPPVVSQPPMIDYWRFKKRLKFFARRRCHILHILQKRQRSQMLYPHADDTDMTTGRTSTTAAAAAAAMNAYEDQAIQEFLQPTIAIRPLRTTSFMGRGDIDTGRMMHSNGLFRNSTGTSGHGPTMSVTDVILEDGNHHQHPNIMMSPQSQEDIYTMAPLSYNLSMDPHAHIGMGSEVMINTTSLPTHHHHSIMDTTTSSSIGCDYVEMKDVAVFHPPLTTSTTTTHTTAVASTNTATLFGVDPTDDSSQTTTVSTTRNEHHSIQTHFCFYPFNTTTTTEPSVPTTPITNEVTNHNVSITGDTPTTPSSLSRGRHPPPVLQRRTIMRKLSISERNEIVSFLEWEMDQCYMYYLSQYSILQQRYQAFIQLYNDQYVIVGENQSNSNNNDRNPIDPEFILSNMIELGDDLIELIAYCTVNTIIAQQILIRYDALALTLEGTPMLNYYLKRVLQPPKANNTANTTTSSYYKVRYHDEIYQLANQFITNIVIASSSTATTTINDSHDSVQAMTSYTTRTYVTHFQAQMDLFRTILDSLQQQVVPTTTTIAATPLRNHSNGTSTSSAATLSSPTEYNHTYNNTATCNTSPSYWYNTLKYTLSSYYETIMRYSIKTYIQMGLFEDRLGLEPGFLSNRGQSLTKEMESIVQWRQKKQNWYTTFYNMQTLDQPLYYYNYYNPLYHPSGGRTSLPTPLSPSTTAGAATTPNTEKKLSGLQVFHLTLNMLAAFLYCMNYYIVEPSSTMYVNRLGAHDAMSGTLIGMMPLAAFVSSIPYSMWTNRSFRHPFIMSSIMLIAGNLMYSFADQFGVVWIALLGRFMAGLGAPKCIIRRYMADTTPVSLRTSVNAGFGMVVAAGSAMGPAMAIVLNRFEYTCYVKHLGLVTLNGLTLPGYFMACLWLTFFVIVVLTFEEPDREGLKEQKELEARGAIPFSPSNMNSFGVPDDHDDIIPATEASHKVNDTNNHMRKDDELYSVFSGESNGDTEPPMAIMNHSNHNEHHRATWIESYVPQWMIRIVHYSDLITLPVRICLGLLFCKVFTIEALVSSTSALTKNRYQWRVTQVGKLGFANGVMVIPFSILVGRLSLTYQDHVLMKWLVSLGCCGMFLLIDLTDLVGTPRYRYNAGHVLAVAPRRYIVGYFISYLSIQAFEGVIGSTLSKVIPTALASGTFNSGLLATLVDTFGRTCGDLFISAAGFLNIRQLMNLLFIPGFTIMLSCLIVIERCRDLLSV